MPLQQLNARQVLDGNMTGAEFNPSLGIYDETHEYPPGSHVLWDARIFHALQHILPTEAGDLSYAPGMDSTSWEVILDYFEGDIELTNPIVNIADGDITRVGGLISSVARGKRDLTITRDGNNLISSVSDGVRTWTYTRDGNNRIVSWEVTIL